MKTIRIKFKSNGETIKKTAIFSDDLSELSKSKKNQADDIIIDYWPDGFCSGIVACTGFRNVERTKK